MAQDFSENQKKIIRRYYDNREQLDEQRLAELCTSLYLATSDKAAQKLWKTAGDLMTRLDVPATRITHVLSGKNPAVLAEVVKDLQSGKIVVKKKPSVTEPPKADS